MNGITKLWTDTLWNEFLSARRWWIVLPVKLLDWIQVRWNFPVKISVQWIGVVFWAVISITCSLIFRRFERGPTVKMTFLCKRLSRGRTIIHVLFILVWNFVCNSFSILNIFGTPIRCLSRSSPTMMWFIKNLGSWIYNIIVFISRNWFIFISFVFSFDEILQSQTIVLEILMLRTWFGIWDNARWFFIQNCCGFHWNIITGLIDWCFKSNIPKKMFLFFQNAIARNIIVFWLMIRLSLLTLRLLNFLIHQLNNVIKIIKVQFILIPRT